MMQPKPSLGIKLERASAQPAVKRRRHLRTATIPGASKNIAALCETVETVEL